MISSEIKEFYSDRINSYFIKKWVLTILNQLRSYLNKKVAAPGLENRD